MQKVLDNFGDILNRLDEDTKDRAVSIADQLIYREKMADDRALRVAVALAKRYNEMKGNRYV